MQITQSRPADALRVTGVFVALLWVAELVDVVLPARLDENGIQPREQDGLVGVLLAPLLHADWAHLVGNTVPLLVLGFFLGLSGVRTWVTVTAVVWLASGLGTWLIAQPGTVHVGASGIVFGWLTFLVVRGFLTRDAAQIVLGVIVLVAYGGLLWGVLPSAPGVSWEGHLCGAAGGVLAAMLVASRREERV